MFVRPKKSLGQHFLKDKNIARKIVDSLQLQPNGNVLEIGPGMGVLTCHLLKKENSHLTCIEIDNESVKYLLTNYPELEKRILQSDFLTLNIANSFPEPFSIIGNFPYNISSQIFFRIIENRDLIPQVVCMIQKEVAERISAPPGNKTYGILSVLLQAYYDIKYLFTVKENVFTPPPKVKSAVIRLIRNETKNLDCNEEMFFKVVKTAFNQRRKTLRNSLRQMYTSEVLALEVFNKRPEQLGVQEFVYLTKLAKEK